LVESSGLEELEEFFGKQAVYSANLATSVGVSATFLSSSAAFLSNSAIRRG